MEFHIVLAEFLDNDILNNMMRMLFSAKEMLVFGNEEFGYLGGISFHMQITDAIEKHDAERARDLMEEHQAEYYDENVW